MENEDLSDTEKVLLAITRKGEISRKEVEGFLGTSKFPAICALNELIDAQKIIKTGSGPTVRYKLAK